MFAVIVNTVAIILGSALGLCLSRGLPKSLTDALMEALGLCTILIGIQGAIKEENILLLIVAIVVGVLIGEAIDLDGKVNRFAERVTRRFNKEGTTDSARIANAFVTSCLIMNVGAMVIVGSLDAGLRADYTMLYTKSLLDFISGIMMTAAMGIGPGDLTSDTKTFGLLFETLAIRDLRTYAEEIDGRLYHYLDKSGLECDAVMHLANGAYGLIEIKLGGDDLIKKGVVTLNGLADKIDMTRMKRPSFKMVLTAHGDFVYPYKDTGVLVCPIGCLKGVL